MTPGSISGLTTDETLDVLLHLLEPPSVQWVE